MEGARCLAAALAELPCATPRVTVFSNSTGGPYPDEPDAVRALLAEHLVRPVRFVDQVRRMYDAGARTFLEVGPGRVLTGLARQCLADRDALVLEIDAGAGGGVTQLLHTLAALFARGVAVDLERLFEGRALHPADLSRARATARTPGWVVNGRRARALTEPRRTAGPSRITVAGIDAAGLRTA
jgi:acyl transferase domain-containing protein